MGPSNWKLQRRFFSRRFPDKVMLAWRISSSVELVSIGKLNGLYSEISHTSLAVSQLSYLST